jgi:hypothetical protein
MEYLNLLDCNRLQSVEYRSNNENANAVYTNEFPAGVQVNIGDKISVHNAYISETGSEDNSIQISDKVLENRTITYTKLDYINPIKFDNTKVLGYERVTASNVTETITNSGNSTSILYNYYITAHGENTVNLPRRFSFEGLIQSQDWDDFDTVTRGRIFGNHGLLTTVNASYNGSRIQNFMCNDDYFYFSGHEASASATVDHYKQRNDNSRYMLFVQEETRYGGQSDEADLEDIVSASLTSPAQLNYIEYIEKIDLNIPKGFKSPETIADILTRQLQKQGEPEVFKYSTSATFGPATSLRTQRPLSVEINSPTYHTFYAQSNFTNNFDNWNLWDNATGDTAESLRYLSSYQYIGVKRPGLFIASRNFLNYFLKLLNSRIPVADARPNISYANLGLSYQLQRIAFRKDAAVERSHTIVTDMLWNQETLLLLSKYFNEQGNHPELFTNDDNPYSGFTTPQNSRFLHLNLLRDSARGATYSEMLGTDYLKNNASATPYLNTAPLFFDFNPEYKDILTEGVSWETGYAYGVFKKYTADGIPSEGVIAFTTNHLGYLDNDDIPADQTTIPAPYFSINDGAPGVDSVIHKDTRLGIDSHFNAYGNVMVSLIDGHTDYMYDKKIQINRMYPTPYGPSEIPTYFYSQKIYCGADNPQINYNPTSNKFEIENLHTAERIQNRYNAGGVESDGTTDSIVSEFGTAGDKVWKINKRLYNTSFTPSVRPYLANRISDLKVDLVDYSADFLNPNLQGWTIYDQLCGIIIKDFGYSKDYWNEGFFGRCGFTYEQFNASRNSTNDITARVGNNNKDALPYAFTNADIKQESTMDLMTNIFGAGLYNLSLPITTSWNASNHGVNLINSFRKDLDFEYFPEISKAQTSIKLTAPNLPSKLVNPYYNIRTDVLDDSQYYGGKNSNQPLPIIATIAKSSDYNNFFVSLDGGLEFTFTKNKIITSIRTSITDPDGTVADISGNSAVIYKLIKTLPIERLDVLGSFLNNQKQSKI